MIDKVWNIESYESDALTAIYNKNKLQDRFGMYSSFFSQCVTVERNHVKKLDFNQISSVANVDAVYALVELSELNLKKTKVTVHSKLKLPASLQIVDFSGLKEVNLESLTNCKNLRELRLERSQAGYTAIGGQRKQNMFNFKPISRNYELRYIDISSISDIDINEFTGFLFDFAHTQAHMLGKVVLEIKARGTLLEDREDYIVRIEEEGIKLLF